MKLHLHLLIQLNQKDLQMNIIATVLKGAVKQVLFASSFILKLLFLRKETQPK